MAKTKATKVEPMTDTDKAIMCPVPSTPSNGDYFNEWNQPVTVVEEQEGVTVVVVRAQDDTNPFDASLIDNLSTNDVEVKPTHD